MGIKDFLSQITENTDDRGAQHNANENTTSAPLDNEYVNRSNPRGYIEDEIDIYDVGTQTSTASPQYKSDEEDENEPSRKAESIISKFWGRKPEKQPKETTENSAYPDIKTFCPMSGTDANRICDAIIAGKYVHVKFDQLINKINAMQDNHTTFLKILYATSGCAYAVGAEVFRIDENTLDFLVIPKGKRYESELPEDFIEVNASMYNIPKN